MQQSGHRVVNRVVSGRGVFESELVRADHFERKLTQQTARDVASPVDSPLVAEPRRDRRNLAAPYRQPPSVELTAKTERHRLRPIPGSDHHHPLVREQR